MKFEHNGYRYITDGEDQVKLMYMEHGQVEVYLPKYALYDDKRYLVTSIEPEKIQACTRYNTETDGRKKPKYEYSYYDVPANIYKDECDGLTLRHRVYNLRKVNFPDSIRLIGDYAFYGFQGLESLSLPETVEKIGKYAFYGCGNVAFIDFSNHIKSIGERAFGECINIHSLVIPDSVSSIGKGAFYKCIQLKELTIGSGVANIEERAFWGCDKLRVVHIYNEPFEVMIAPNAFPNYVELKYHKPEEARRKYISQDKSKELSSLLGLLESNISDKRTTKYSEINNESSGINNNDLERLMSAVVVDGIITDKERSVILKKALNLGYDKDEFEILLDAKLYEVEQNARTPKSVSDETINKDVIEITAKAKVNIDSIAETDEVPWAEMIWTPLKEKLSKMSDVKCSKPADRSYTIYKIKSINAQIVPWYRVKTNEAGVALETYGGEDVKAVIENILSKAPVDSIVRQAELSQGKKNKDKWNWTVIANIDKNDSGIIQWYADAILAFSSLIEGQN